jgi:peptide-methionine (S)-S-oxide reductase
MEREVMWNPRKLLRASAVSGYDGDAASTAHSQYRSEIFATTAEQVRIAQAYIAQLDQAKAFPKTIVTKVARDTGFYPAEAYHQNFLTLHPDSPYIATFDLPKIAALQEVFPSTFRSEPVLVTRQSS